MEFHFGIIGASIVVDDGNGSVTEIAHITDMRQCACLVRWSQRMENVEEIVDRMIFEDMEYGKLVFAPKKQEEWVSKKRFEELLWSYEELVTHHAEHHQKER